jgi:hypothetical protein
MPQNFGDGRRHQLIEHYSAKVAAVVPVTEIGKQWRVAVSFDDGNVWNGAELPQEILYGRIV